MTTRVETGIPGFVDLQVNGFMGVNFSSPDLTEPQFAAACRQVLARGTAAFLPTLITGPESMYERNLPLMVRQLERDEFRGQLLGFHIEGPFISPQPGAVGAHPPQHVLPPDAALLERIFDWACGHVRLITLAAGIPGMDQLARIAVRHGATISVGHSLGEERELEEMAAAGATALTHLGNGLPNLLHRHHNPVWAGLADDRYSAMLISDGHHLPPSLIKTAIRAKGVDRIVIVSDAFALAGLPPGRYEALGMEAVLEESGLLHSPERQCMVGSSATMLQCMNYLSSLELLGLDDLLAVGFHNPLRLVGLDRTAVRAGTTTLFDEDARTFVML